MAINQQVPIQNSDQYQGGLNMLVFDEVCNNRMLPLDPLGSVSGNWVLEGKAGLMAISGDNFWTNYMINVRIRLTLSIIQ
jgi:hypothetical protein